MIPYSFPGLPRYTRPQVALWNWYQRAVPGEAHWREWLRSSFSEILQAPAGAEAWLEETHSIESREPVRHRIEKPETALGRAPENDVVLAAQAIGGRHAKLFLKDGTYWIEDLGTKLGTYIGSRKLPPGQPQRLEDGDAFTVFPYSLRFRERRKWAAEPRVELGCGPVRFTSWGGFRRRQAVGTVMFAVHLDPAYGSTCLEAERPFLEEVASRALYPLERSPGLGEIEDAVLEYLLLGVIRRAAESLAFPLRLSLGPCGRAPEWNGEEPGIEAAFTIALSSASGAFRLFAPESLLDAMSRTAPGESIGLPEVAWPLPAAIARVDLTAEDLSKVEPGDVLMPEQQAVLLLPGSWTRGWKARLWTEKGVWRLAIENTLETTFTMEEQELDGLPVRIHVVLGEKELTLSELRRLEPGSVFELERGTAEPVRLVANGKLLGEGQLVEVEGRMGVRILWWKKAS